MPTYEYACSSCRRRFEVVQRFSDAPLETCEVCGGALKRVFHPVGIVLKGSGFYSTDARSSKKSLTPTEKASEGSSTSDGGSTSGGGTSGGGSSEGTSSAPAKKSDASGSSGSTSSSPPAGKTA